MQKVIGHYIFPEEIYSCTTADFMETRNGLKIPRGSTRLVVEEVFATENGNYFNGIFATGFEVKKLMFCKMDINSLPRAKEFLSKTFVKKVEELFKEISDKI